MAKNPAKTKALTLHKKGATQREIAKKLNISLPTINKWINEPLEADKTHLSLMKKLEAHIISLIKSVDVNKIDDVDKSTHIIKAYEIYTKLAAEVFKNDR